MSASPIQTEIPEAATLGEIVRSQPAAAVVFEQLGFEFCCGGGQTLAAACAEKGLDPATVSVMLDALIAAGADVGGHDLSQASIGEICDHIVSQHHEPFREAEPKLTETVEKVVRVHGSDHPELADLERHYRSMRDEMLQHTAREERELFPAVREASATGDRIDQSILAELESDHRAAGQELEAIRAICADFDMEQAFCNTHRLMLHSLQELERDTHQHVHEENNILFPLIREQLV